MSDTANPPNLASVDDFDARLKRTDEDRWLATRYAPQAARERLVAIYLLYQELQRALQTKEAMLGKIRIQWWRETLEQVGATAALGPLLLDGGRPGVAPGSETASAGPPATPVASMLEWDESTT